LAQAQPFAGGAERFYRMVQKLVGVTPHHAVQDLGFHAFVWSTANSLRNTVR
jgi:hypothetical protein